MYLYGAILITIQKLKGTQGNNYSNANADFWIQYKYRKFLALFKFRKLYAIYYNTNTKYAQDPEVPEAVKQFESLVSDGAGEGKYTKVWFLKILILFLIQILIFWIRIFSKKYIFRGWRYSCPSFCAGTRGGRCHGKGFEKVIGIFST